MEHSIHVQQSMIWRIYQHGNEIPGRGMPLVTWYIAIRVVCVSQRRMNKDCMGKLDKQSKKECSKFTNGYSLSAKRDTNIDLFSVEL